MTTKIEIKSPLRLSYYKGNIVAVIYYNHRTFRYNLAKVPKECFLEKSMMLKQSNKLSNLKQLADEISIKTDLLKKVTDELIEEMSSGETLKKRIVDERMMLIASGRKNKHTLPSMNSFTEDFRVWLYEGKGSKRKQITKKDFVSAYHLLKDFESVNGSFTIDDFDEDLLRSFIEFSYETHDNTDEHIFFSKGNLSNRTLNKRLDSIWTFISEYYKIDPKTILDTRHLKVTDKDIICLSLDELHSIEQLNIVEPELAKARDYFVFLCWTGLRFGDFEKLDHTFVDAHKNALVLTTNKTGKSCQIYLFDKAKEIGEKYNYQFAPVNNQVLNRHIKEFLSRYNMLSEEITISYQAKDTRTVTKKKREFIGCHTGRRTYISILAEHGMKIDDIMSSTGHKTVQMLLKYMNRFGKERLDKYEEMNSKLNKRNTYDN